MQIEFSELKSLPVEELPAFLSGLNSPLLVTDSGEPRFIVQPLEVFEDSARRLRSLESAFRANTPEPAPRRFANVIPLRR
jgi:hypothetical protein